MEKQAGRRWRKTDSETEKCVCVCHWVFIISEEHVSTYSLFVTITSFSGGGGGSSSSSSTKTVMVKTIVEDIVDGKVVSSTTN